MTGSEAFAALLETFQGCTRRGERATLFLETKNGNEVATLKVELPARPGTTSVGLARKKSPSTVKRDKARMEKFVQRKTLQETWCPPATSSPSIKTEKHAKQDMVIQDLVNEYEPDKFDAGEIRNDDNASDENGKEHLLKLSESQKLKIDESVSSMLAGLNRCAKEINDGMLKKTDLQTIGTKGNNNVEGNLEDNNDDTDNIEDAKLWALSQKQNFLKT